MNFSQQFLQQRRSGTCSLEEHGSLPYGLGPIPSSFPFLQPLPPSLLLSPKTLQGRESGGEKRTEKHKTTGWGLLGRVLPLQGHCFSQDGCCPRPLMLDGPGAPFLASLLFHCSSYLPWMRFLPTKHSKSPLLPHDCN